MENALDFWLGDWDVSYGDGGKGTNRITRRLGGRVVLEEFASPALNGMSVSVFSAQRGCWLQTWVDEQGGYMLFAGGPRGDEFVLDQENGDGRMVFRDIRPDGLTWDWQRRGASGWESRWLITYRRSNRSTL